MICELSLGMSRNQSLDKSCKWCDVKDGTCECNVPVNLRKPSKDDDLPLRMVPDEDDPFGDHTW